MHLKILFHRNSYCKCVINYSRRKTYGRNISMKSFVVMHNFANPPIIVQRADSPNKAKRVTRWRGGDFSLFPITGEAAGGWY